MQNAILVHFITLQVGNGEQPEAHADQLDPWQLVLDASPVVKLVMLALVLMSVVCWFIIGAKLVRIASASHQSGRFLDLFWAQESSQGWTAERLESVYAQVNKYRGSPVAAVFRAGYVELARIASGEAPAGGTTGNIERALRRSKNQEMTSLENFLSFLATTGSTAPFIGLFGTVWGIMNSFISIGAQKNASLDVVAPGIAEALIATAIGLLAAIPAVIAYNYFVRRLRVIEGDVDSFSNDYLNIVRRHFLSA
jgi:biopolymer transport protein TolQ